MQEPQTRITPPLRRTPPGQQRGQPPSSSRGQIRSSVSMSSQPVSTPQTTTPVPDISPKPGASGTSSWSPPDEIKPRLLPERSPRRSSANAAPGRFDAYPRRADVGGPAILHLSHSTAFRNRFLHQPPFAFVTHRSPGSQHEEITHMHGFFDPAGSADGSRKRRQRCCLPLIHSTSAPRYCLFRGCIAGLRAPRNQRFAAPSRVANAWSGPSRFARSSMWDSSIPFFMPVVRRFRGFRLRHRVDSSGDDELQSVSLAR